MDTTTVPSWITLSPSHVFEINPLLLTDEGVYNFRVKFSDIDSALDVYQDIEVTLFNPCETTSLTGTAIDDITLKQWMLSGSSKKVKFEY